MGITSRKAATLFSDDTLAFAANHKAKSDRSPRPRRSRACRSFSSPQPAGDRRQSPAWKVEPPRSAQITLPCPPVEGDPATVTWVAFRETYVALAEAAFSKATVSDWRRAEAILEEEFSPKLARDLTPAMLEAFEDFVCEAGYSKYRIEGFMSRWHHMIRWGCEAGYLERETFGLGPDLKWPPKRQSAWTVKLAARRGGERGSLVRSPNWRDARRQYEATILDSMASRTTAIALDDFERLCGPPSLADASASLPAFVEALRGEGVDPASLDIYRGVVVSFVSWTSNQWRVAA